MGWSWAPREDTWEDRLAEVARFFAAHGRVPRVRAEDAEEASLGLWASRQRRAANVRAMPYARLALWGEFARQLETDDFDS
ncbi:MAG: helicase associated domain-containing protein [Cryobacterium sp.]|nr:helicase associated domain-containing protein [Cryobacterium sp.]